MAGVFPTLKDWIDWLLWDVEDDISVFWSFESTLSDERDDERDTRPVASKPLNIQ